ncbi:hypothetical protein GGE12_005360 [Rhizobium mongolense]|uniref:Uncharacterized protein n=1 Tax=Rhizobium mongolense TaxID=57676 RepID=A0A7W6WHB7_9HYPH|nr:hypothetical protein [Rhizobium mongolense]
MKLRIERETRLLMNDQTEADGRVAFGSILAELLRLGITPEPLNGFRNALHFMNLAAHGFDVAPEATVEASKAATSLLERRPSLCTQWRRRPYYRYLSGHWRIRATLRHFHRAMRVERIMEESVRSTPSIVPIWSIN